MESFEASQFYRSTQIVYIRNMNYSEIPFGKRIAFFGLSHFRWMEKWKTHFSEYFESNLIIESKVLIFSWYGLDWLFLSLCLLRIKTTLCNIIISS